ncbi:hypothetical protein PV726_47600 [Streptomyces europaeiscabiei]|uniref:hypothetical protein n=1 Tax=Streptomyces europaeiscabiei TaxID=146819 RepID=UPI0029AC1050|nr:hypothetical protein [Streptomyces europaeiscabiei]MDX3697712.1 hypothetical protein [Streptomyces europaeiscabiei]
MTWWKLAETVCAVARWEEDEHGEHIDGVGGDHVDDKQSSDGEALTELRKRLADGLAVARLSRTQLVKQACVGRTKVWEALTPGQPVPSAETVAALARVLKLPVPVLLELRRTAVEGEGMVTRGGLGRPIQDWDPHVLEVHPAGLARSPSAGSGMPAGWALPGYVPREHDAVLAEAVRDVAAGRSRIVVLVGSSSTGKTRACWEAVRSLAENGWRLWHPFDPTHAESALEGLHRVRPRTVVWLNEAQHYFGKSVSGERIAAAVHHLLVTPERGPVLVLGTLWPEYEKQYTALPRPREEDPHSRTRELLAGQTVTVPDAFDAPALAAAAALAEKGDPFLADALPRTRSDGRVTQDLAGAPLLLKRYQLASPAARAMLDAAMDARRLGVGPHLPQTFLTDAAIDYLTDTEYDQLTDDWTECAYAELAELVHGKQAPLRRTTPRPPRRPSAPVSPFAAPIPSAAGPVLRLADYLEQYGRSSRSRLCPPASFWYAAHAHLTHPEDLSNLAREAESRRRLQWAHCLRLRATETGGIGDLQRQMEGHVAAGNWQNAEALAQQAADNGAASFLHSLAHRREGAGDLEHAEALYWKAFQAGDTGALTSLAMSHDRSGNDEEALALCQRAAGLGDAKALLLLGFHQEETGDHEAADVLYQQAANAGHPDAEWQRIRMLETAGDQQGAETLAQQMTGTSVGPLIGDSSSIGTVTILSSSFPVANASPLCRLALLREESGNRSDAEALAQQAASKGNTSVLASLAAVRMYAGDLEGVETLTQQVVQTGNGDALYVVARQLDKAGDRVRAEALYRQALDAGAPDAWFRLARLRADAGDWADVEALTNQALEDGDPRALQELAKIREWAGDLAGAERVWRKALETGDTTAMVRLVWLRAIAGDRDGAEGLAQQSIGRGNSVEILSGLAKMWEEAGLREAAERLYEQAAEAGDPMALRRLAWLREAAGDRESAEALAQQAADSGSGSALYGLAIMREWAGDREDAQALARQVADAGWSFALGFDKSDWRLFEERTVKPEHWWPYGLDPDGTPTSPWQ